MFRLLIIIVCLMSSAVFSLADGTAIATGDAQLKAGQFQEALETYLGALKADSRDVPALMGAAQAYNTLNQSSKATQMMDRAVAASPRDRAVVHNAAIQLFKTDQQPRAIKLVKEYLSANPKPADEPLLYELQYMLENATPETKKSRPCTEATAFVEIYIKSLESQVQGFKKWGRLWEDATVVTERLAANKKLDVDLNILADKINTLERDITSLDRQTADIEMKVRRGFEPFRTLRRHQDMVSLMRQDRARYVDQRDAVLAKLNRPSFSEEPGWIAMGTPAPTLPDAAILAASKAPPAPVDPVTPQQPANAGNGVPPAQPPVVGNGGPDTVPVAPVKPPVAKRVTQYGVAFAISQDTLVASHALVNGATDIIVQTAQGTTDEAKVIKSDAESGLVLLRITKLKAAPLKISQQFNGGRVQCVGMPNVDLFRPSADAISGTSAAPKEPWTVSLDKNPRMSGAPLVSDGKVVGVTLADRDSEPASIPAVTLDRLTKLLADQPPSNGPFTNDPKAAVFQLIVTRQEK